MKDQQSLSSGSASLKLTTNVPNVELRELIVADADAWIDLVERNRAHLTQFGEGLPPHTIEDVTRWLASPREYDLRLGIWGERDLMGFVEASHLSFAIGGEDLLADSPDGWVLGYWVGSEYTRKGYTIAACRAVIEYVRSERGAKEFWSSARHGNVASMALLERLGFSVVQERPTGLRYYLKLQERGE